MTDRELMARALALAERGRGRTSPNPMVGAVIVDAEGVVVGRGQHEVAGGPHAEVHALADAGERARGGTLYCTLEPCSHTGRTGPCAPLVASAGIKRAVIAVEDPNPLVAGAGLAYLRERGVQVDVGVMREAAERLNGPFFTVMRARRPFVTMKVALSADGCVAAAPGTRTLLTGGPANRLIHRERAEADAIAVGSGTILADDPVLTPRGAYRSRPLTRVVLDRRLRMPASARLLATSSVGPIIVMTAAPLAGEAADRARRLDTSGARVEVVDAAGGFLAAALTRLAELQVTSVILEGGPAVHRDAWTAGLVDRVQIFRTRHVVGPGGVPWLDAAVFTPAALTAARVTPLGDDQMLEGYVHRLD